MFLAKNYISDEQWSLRIYEGLLYLFPGTEALQFNRDQWTWMEPVVGFSRFAPVL